MKTSPLLVILGFLSWSAIAQAIEPDDHPIAVIALLDNSVRLAAGAMATRAGSDSDFNCEQRYDCEVGGISAETAGHDRLAGTADFEGYLPYVGLEWSEKKTSSNAADRNITRFGVVFTSTPEGKDCRGSCDRAPERLHKDFDTAFAGASLKPMVRLDWSLNF